MQRYLKWYDNSTSETVDDNVVKACLLKGFCKCDISFLMNTLAHSCNMFLPSGLLKKRAEKKKQE